jgi:hypothetical protein
MSSKRKRTPVQARYRLKWKNISEMHK